MSKKLTIATRITNRLTIVSPLIRRIETERQAEVCRTLAMTGNREALSKIASLLPSPVGRYYAILARNEWGDPAAFDIAGLYDIHRPRALLNIAQCFRHWGDLRYATKIAVESHDKAIYHRDWFTVAQAQKELAIIRSTGGDHRGAADLIESAWPLIHGLRRSGLACEVAFIDYHNALAVELNELGRIEEAGGALSVALASPFVNAYPEWRETQGDIQSHGRVDRSTVAVSMPVDCNVVEMAPRAKSTPAVAHAEPARVLNFQRALAMVKKKTKEKEESPAPVPEASLREQELELLKLLLDEELDQQAINCITGVVQTSPKRREFIAQILTLPEEQIEQLIKKMRS